MQSVGFIGGGRVTRILAGGWRRAGTLPERLLVHEPNRDALNALEAEIPGMAVVTAQAASTADVVFVALHPPAVLAAISEVKAFLRRDAILVSLAPKITIAALEHAAGTSRIARTIPNAPSLIGRGYNPVVFGRGVDDAARRTLSELFAPWGQAPEVAESELEAYAILTAMGPTYFWYQWQALRDLASQFGLTAAATDAALHAMLDGALRTLLDAGLSPAATMDLIPVKPLAELEPSVAAAYRTVLPALHAKIRPAESALA